MHEASLIRLGSLAAERDNALREYFVQSPAYGRVRSGEKSIIIGPRGSGKTAVLRMVADHARRSGAAVVELTPEDYSYELLRQTVLPEQAGAWGKKGRYASAWRYLMYVCAMRAVNARGGAIKAGAAGEIYAYLRDRHAVHTNPVATLIGYLQRFDGITVGPVGVTMRAGELDKLFQLDEIRGLLPALNDLCARHPVLIVVDELDKGWDGSEDARAFVSGLFQAANSINHRTPNVRIVMGLRRELYESIPELYEDAEKVRDTIEMIRWDEVSLLDLIARRLAHFVPDLATLAPRAQWRQVFGARSAGDGRDSYDYVVDRTLLRPREVIGFCQSIVDAAVTMRMRTPFPEVAMRTAERTYSQARVRDLASECRYQYPALQSVIETFRGKPYKFESGRLEEHLLDVSVGVLPVDPAAAPWCSGAEPADLVDILWRVGFLRARTPAGHILTDGSEEAPRRYFGPDRGIAVNLRASTRFDVHPMFHDYLAVRTAGPGLPSESIPDVY